MYREELEKRLEEEDVRVSEGRDRDLSLNVLGSSVGVLTNEMSSKNRVSASDIWSIIETTHLLDLGEEPL